MVIIRAILGVAAAASAVISNPATAQSYGGCGFNKVTLQFAGTVEQTARCLLRKVRPQGAGADAQSVPAELLARVTRPIAVSAAQMSSYLRAHGIADQLTQGLASHTTPPVRYFVIHDTSSPEEAGEVFPANINEASYGANNLATSFTGVRRKVNLIISRDGHSRRLVPWGQLPRDAATKIEVDARAPRAKLLFVHVENVQPRLKPAGSGFFWKAPTPGLTAPQERRLALAYIVASVHAGKWLIPAYHYNIDQNIPGAHDDPQNMDLTGWFGQVLALEREIARLPRQ